jgi:hypothetical protein
MTYRILKPEEWHRLEAIFGRQGQIVPPYEAAMCAVAEDDSGEISGCLFLQIAVHMEPLIIENPRVNFLRLQKTLEAALEGRNGLPYYCFTDGSAKMSRICELGGFKRIGEFWRKEVK